MGVITGLDEGWVYIYDNSETDYMQVLCEGGWSYNEKTEPEIEDLPSDTRYGYNLEIYTRDYSIKGIYFDNHSDWDTFHQKLKDWNGSGMWLKFKISSSDDFAVLDSDGNEKINVFYESSRGWHKEYKGDATFFKVDKINFRQKG